MVRLKSKNRNKNEEIKKSLKFSVVDGSAHSVMEGFGKSYIAPFAIALKASNTMVGVISSLPDLIGSLAQLGSTRLVEHFKSRKKIIVFCALIQALLWLPLFFVPLLFSNYGPMIVLLFVTLQAVVSYTINPLWNSMMGDLVPENERGKYFGRRNMITGAFVFVSTFVAGFLLNHFSKTHPFYGFGILFCAAFSARLVSALYLSRMYDQEYIVDRESYFSFFDFTKRMAHNNYGRFVLYLCVFTFVVYLASPFFAVYMLRDLKFSYMTFTLITLGSLIASFAGMHFWGRYNDENGSKKLIYFNGLLIPFLPIMWLFTTNVYALFAIEMFSGFVWAGFNLGTSNFIFDATTPQKRMRCITYYNVLRALAMFLGATIGGLLATHTSSSVFISSIPILFLVSGILRLIVSLMFLPMLKEMRLIEVPLGHSTFRTYLTIKPKEGIVYETIGTHKKESGNSKDDNSKEDGKIKFKLEEKNLSEKEVLNKNLDKYLNKKKLKQTKDK